MTTKQKPQKNPIDDFNGYYQFLNNDFPSWVQYQGILYPNINTAFQAARTSNQQTRKKISLIQNYDQFKQLVSTIKNPQNWYANRYKIMQKLIRDKFKRNKQIANKIASTEQRKLYNCYNTSGQNELYWGVVKQKDQKGLTTYRGSNNLGRILQIVRSDIISMTDTQKWIAFQNLQQDADLFPQTSLIVLKQSKAIDKLLLQNRNYFLFGSHPKSHFKLEHPSSSKFHAAIYFSELQVIIIDNNSTHGTFVIKNNIKQKLQPFQKTVLENGDSIVFGLSSRTYLCNISFVKAEAALKRKQQQKQKNIKQLSQASRITENMDRDQIKSRIGFKKYQGIHVKNINQNYSYNDIKQLFKKYGSVQKVRLLQDYRNNKFQGQVVVIYESRHKIQDIIKQITRNDDKQISKFQLIPIDKYDMEKILDKNKEDRKYDRQRHRDDDRKHDYRDKNRDQYKRDDRKRSRSRDKDKKDKYKKYDKDY